MANLLWFIRKRMSDAWHAFLARPAATSNAMAEKQAEAQWTKLVARLTEVPVDIRALYGLPAADGQSYKMPMRVEGVLPSKFKMRDDPTLKLAMDSGYEEVYAADQASEPLAWQSLNSGGALGLGVTFLGFPYLAELEQITEYRTPAESLAIEMTRRWFKLNNKGKEELDDKMQEITQRCEALNLQGLVRKCIYKCEWFGRSHIYVSIKGQDDDITRQLPLDKIEKGTLLGFADIESYWLTPYSWNSTHPERPDFYKPQSWFVLGRKTHHTRLMTFILREVPDLLKPAYDFSGISMTQLMMPYVTRWQRTAKSVNDLINIFSILTLSTDLAALTANTEKFMARLKAFTVLRDNKGILAIDKGREELAVNDVSLGSLDKLQAQAQEHMATPSRLPLIKFFGVTPTGLNATAEPELNVHAEYVHAMQELINPVIKRMLDLIQMDMYGEVDPNIGFEWLELREPTKKEVAELRKADSDRFASLIQNNVIDPDEVRNELRTDPDSGFSNLVGKAPKPQDWSGGTGEEEEVDIEKN
jgi:uncharacterized protein